MKRKPPQRRKFANAWDEIQYLYQQLLYWLYQREDAGRARSYAERLEKLLPQVDPKQEAILGAECWSLVHEAKGDLRRAIRHRENEIRLIRRLHEIAHQAPEGTMALSDYSCEDLSDRLDLLATLYHDSGDLNKAIQTLHESKQVCDAHGLKFDGEDLLQEYLEEKRQGAAGKTERNGKVTLIRGGRGARNPVKKMSASR
jgi:tetratricopeptide (TPR) repeat protein